MEDLALTIFLSLKLGLAPGLRIKIYLPSLEILVGILLAQQTVQVDF